MRREGGQNVNKDAVRNNGYTLRLDMWHLFPGGVPERLRYALECRQKAESLSFRLECDMDHIEKTAQKLAETTGITYLQAIDEVSRHIEKAKEPTLCSSLCAALAQPIHRPKMNRAQRRRLKREKRK